MKSPGYPLAVILLAATVFAAGPARAQDAGGETVVANLDAAQVFDLAEQARAAGDLDTAEKALRALMADPEMEIRNEARFRLARIMVENGERYREAAVLLRQILDEQPDAGRVRLELARIQAQLGNLREAERELRAAQAAGLPPEVERLVRFYAAALGATRTSGFNAELALAPDSNINRATRSDTLETVIGDFTLSDDAKAKSGLGLSMRGQAWGRVGVAKGLDLNVSASAAGRFYRESSFDDYVVSLQAGPQLRSGADQFTLSATGAWRWFGQSPYSVSYGVTGDYRHPTGKRSQLRLDGTAIQTDDRLNDLRSARRYSLGAGIDRAFTARAGGGVRVSGYREVANDPGYSTANGGIDLYAFCELGSTTLVARLDYDHLEADKRVFLYPKRRIDDRYSAELSGTFRALRVGSIAPLLRLRYEKSASIVGIYSYDRVSAEIGVASAF
ncbi:surface lipoprotein assembly modifier [Croceibacterium salegens]|nr:surface lipoprotein assembly modifier [Croceibacterium salegens]